MIAIEKKMKIIPRGDMKDRDFNRQERPSASSGHGQSHRWRDAGKYISAFSCNTRCIHHKLNLLIDN